MSSYVGPNGRIYRRERSLGKWIAIAIISVIAIAAAIFGLPIIAAAQIL
jgi:hypothetical protein